VGLEQNSVISCLEFGSMYVSKKIKAASALGAMAASSLGLIAPASATTTFEVTDCDANASHGFQTALTTVDGAGGGTITFNLPSSCTSISLTETFNQNHPLTISGPSTNIPTISLSNTTWFLLDNSFSDLSISNLNFDVSGAFNGGGFIASTFDASPTNHITINNVDYLGAGGMSIYAQDVTISDSSFHSPANTSSAGDYIWTNASLTISGSEFVGNGFSEGSLIHSGGALNVSESTLSELHYDGLGGGYAFQTESTANLTNVDLSTSNLAGFVATTGDVTVIGSRIRSNTLESWGGTAGSLNIQTSQFSNNTASAGSGLSAGTFASVTHSLFGGNTGSADMVNAYGGDVTVSASAFVSNQVGYGLIVAGTHATVNNNTFTLNNMDSISMGSVIDMSFNTFVDNSYGDGVPYHLASNGQLTMLGNIVATTTNTPATCSGSGNTDLGGNLFTFQPENCDAFPTTPGSGHSAVVPFADLHLTSMHHDPATGIAFFELDPGSVAIDYLAADQAGDSDYLLNVDQLDHSRPQNAKYDAGSIETVNETLVTCVASKVGRISFHANSAKLTTVSKKALRRYARVIATSGCSSVVVKGYTSTVTNSSKAGQAYRINLATHRAKAVKKYLASQFARLQVTVHISQYALATKSPVASNATATGRAKNRRVEISTVASSS
jgi:outer membrane protein OmpA-like peptidoglycan-associated protein